MILKLEDIIEKAEKLCEHLECDGAVRVLDYLLTENKILHQVKLGKVDMGEENIPYHFWIELYDERIIDIKARMWMKNKKVPHGVFKKENTKAVYSGETVQMNTSKTIFQILTHSSLES